MVIEMSLANARLYEGCEIQEVNGRRALMTPPGEAAAMVGRNIERIMLETADKPRDVVVLTGPMAFWAYLVVFHAVVHRFREVRYDDGRGGYLVVAKHG